MIACVGVAWWYCVDSIGMVQKLLTLLISNRPLRSRFQVRQEEISSRQGGAMFLESSFFPAFQNLFLGVLRASSEAGGSIIHATDKTIFCFRKSVNQFFRKNEPSHSIKYVFPQERASAGISSPDQGSRRIPTSALSDLPCPGPWPDSGAGAGW
jgi:hypothetical protein